MPRGIYERSKPPTRRPVAERFFEKVDATGPCWEWTASTNHGYGQFQLNRQTMRAHRMSWELLVGPIPAGLHLDHLCKNRRCVNPDHLEPVTPAVNNRRKTHCRNGHEYTPENTYHGKQPGWRRCRTCVLSRKRKEAAQ